MKANQWIYVILLILLLPSCKEKIWQKKLSEHVSVHIFENDKCKVYNALLGEYTTPLLDGVDYVDATDSTAAFCVDGLCGIIDVETGKIRIDAQYKGTWVLSEGLIAVQNDSNKIGFVNWQNEVVIPFIFERDEQQSRYGTSFYQFKDGYCIMGNGKGLFGLIDKKGNWVVEPQYDYIYKPQACFREVQKGDKVGVLSPTLQAFLPIRFDRIEFSAVDTSFIVVEDGCMHVIDKNGKFREGFYADKIERMLIRDDLNDDGVDTYTYSFTYLKYEVNGRIGIYDTYHNTPILKAMYDSVCLLPNDLLEVYNPQTKVSTIISLGDLSNQYDIDYQYD